MAKLQKITPCLWFDSDGEEAARFYAEIFPNSKVGAVTRYTEAGREIHGREPGSALTVAFTLDGQEFTALNGGPMFKFSEAISFQVACDTQAEVDHYWEKLVAGGDPACQQCGWLKDKYGLSWQIVPAKLGEWMSDPEKASRVLGVLLGMKKLDLAKLEAAAMG